MPISETQCSKTERAKKFPYWTTTCYRKELAEKVKLSHIKCNTSEKVANQPNKTIAMIHFEKLQINRINLYLFGISVSIHTRVAYPSCLGAILLLERFPRMCWKMYLRCRSHTDEIWWFAKNWTWWCFVNSQRNDNFDVWWTLQQLREVFHCTSPDTPRRTWRRSGLTKDYWVPSQELLHASVHAKYRPYVQAEQPSNLATMQGLYVLLGSSCSLETSTACQTPCLQGCIGHCITWEIRLHTVHHPLSSSLFQPYSFTSRTPAFTGALRPLRPLLHSRRLSLLFSSSFSLKSCNSEVQSLFTN